MKPIFGGVRKYGVGRPLRGDKKKTPIVAIVQRGGGKVVAKAAEDVSGKTLLGMVREYVLPASTIFTDEYRAYDGIKCITTKDGQPAHYLHKRINHSSKVYVVGDVHTNTLRDSGA